MLDPISGQDWQAARIENLEAKLATAEARLAALQSDVIRSVVERICTEHAFRTIRRHVADQMLRALEEAAR